MIKRTNGRLNKIKPLEYLTVYNYTYSLNKKYDI